MLTSRPQRKLQKKLQNLYFLFSECFMPKDYAKDQGRYGHLPLNQSQERTNIPRTKVGDLNVTFEGKNVIMQARIQSSRVTGLTYWCLF
jgi:hypothetical protein